MITSEANTQLKELVKLQKNARYRKRQGAFVVEGLKLTREAALYGFLQRIYISQALYGQMWDGRSEKEIAEEFSEGGTKIVVEILADSVFDKVSDTVTPQGIMGTVRIPKYSLQSLLAVEEGFFLLLDGLQDPGNLGTILRTAEGAGVSGVILSRNSVDIFNPKVVRSTMGSIFRMPFVYVEELPLVIREIRERGIAVYGAMLEESIEYDRVDYRNPSGIVIGNEANGISEVVARELSGAVQIPMCGNVESLNAAAAAAVIMYEAARQRRLSK